MKYQIIARGPIYYLTIAAVIFFMCEDNMLLHESSTGISLVFNHNKCNILTKRKSVSSYFQAPRGGLKKRGKPSF